MEILILKVYFHIVFRKVASFHFNKTYLKWFYKFTSALESLLMPIMRSIHQTVLGTVEKGIENVYLTFTVFII